MSEKSDYIVELEYGDKFILSVKVKTNFAILLLKLSDSNFVGYCYCYCTCFKLIVIVVFETIFLKMSLCYEFIAVKNQLKSSFL